MKFEVNTSRLTLKILGPESASMVLEFYKKNRDIFEHYEPVIGEDFYTLDHQKKVLQFEHNNIMKLIMVRYWIFEKGNPKGYCSEAIEATIPLISSELGIHRFEALILPDNDPSIHMVEKLGFKYEGILRDKIIINGERLDHCMYSFLANN